MKLSYFFTTFLLLSSLNSFSYCPSLEELLDSPAYQFYLSADNVGLDEHHKQGLGQIAQDIADLHAGLQTSSYAEIETHPRISINGNWNQVCLVNLLTLIQNQGVNRKLMNTAAVSSLKMTLDLVDPFLLPFKGVKKFLTSEAVEKAIFTALASNDPEATLWDEIAKMAKANGTDLEESPEAEKLKTKMEHILALYQLSKENKKLPEDSKWHQWSFDPGMSTLDDVLSLVTDVDHTLFSQAMLRFGATPDDENPIKRNGPGEGILQQRLIIKGVSDKSYPLNSPCKAQIMDYEIAIKNYGHVEEGKFVSDYIEYEINLNCCENDEDEDVGYYLPGSESIAYTPQGILPGEDYKMLLGGSIGLGRTSSDNLACAGINVQFFPDFSPDTSGPHISIGGQASYGYRGNTDNSYNFWQTQIKAVPQILVHSRIIPNLHFISGLSFPVTFTKDVSEVPGQPGSFTTDRNAVGVALTTGLSLELKKWNIQVQTDVASYIRTTTSSPQNPGSESVSTDYGAWLNKSNAINVTVNRRIKSF